MRLLAAVGSLLLGALTSVAAVAVHPLWWGLPLGLATTAAVTWALPGRWWGRLPFVGGWVVVVWLAMTPRPEGGYVIGADASGYAVVVAGLVLIVVAVGTLRPGRVPPGPPAGAGPPRAGSDDGSAST